MVWKRSLSIVVAALALVGVVQMAAYAQTAVLRVLNDRVKVGGDSTAPAAPMEVVGAAGTVGTGNSVVLLKNAGDLAFQLDNTTVAGFWNFSAANGENEFRISKSGTGQTEFTLDTSGNVTITGTLTTAGATYPDYVFDDDYTLMSLSEVESYIAENHHLPNIPAASEMKERVNVSDLQRLLLEKVEELTLHTIAQQKAIDELQARLDAKELSETSNN